MIQAEVDGALTLLRVAERDLQAALEEAGEGFGRMGREEWDALLAGVLGAWKHLRYAIRELDPGAWEGYRPTWERELVGNDATVGQS